MRSEFLTGDIPPVQYFFGGAALLGLLFAFIGPDSAHGFGVDIMQWQLQTLVPMAVIVGTHLGLCALPIFERLNHWTKLFVSGFVGAVCFAPLALYLDVLLAGEQIGSGLGSALLSEASGVLPPIVIAWLAMNIPLVLGFTKTKHEKMPDVLGPEETLSKPVDERTEKSAGFLSLVPKERSGNLIYLKSELHYVQVVTNNGKSLVLYNLRDAIDELLDSQGMQPHRSYWVAHDAIERFRRNGRQGELLLTNGERIPVSRGNVQRVKSLSVVETACA